VTGPLTGKLVRDRIPDTIRESGREPVVRRLDAEEFRPALLAKLAEESAELAAAAGPDVLGELADVLEVLRALTEDSGLAWAEVEDQARGKARERGAFRERWFLESAPPEEPEPQEPASE